MTTPAAEPTPGDVVRLVWAGYDVNAQVMEVYGPPNRRHMIVDADIPGPSGEPVGSHVLNVPVSAVRPIVPA